MPQKSNCTLRKVAAAADVSLATASLALTGRGRVSSATRDRVRQVARRMGYQRDQHVAEFMRRVRQDRSMSYRETLAVIDTWPERGAWLRPTANQHYASGIRRRSRELGYALETFWLQEPGLSGRRLEQILRARGVRGLIIPPVIDPGIHIGMDWKQFAAVTIGPSLSLPVNRVCNHRFRTVTLAISRLRERGYRRVGFVMVRHPIPRVDEFWCSGYYTHLAGQPEADQLPPLLQDGLRAPTDGVDPDRVGQLRRWFQQHRPDALLLHTLQQVRELEAAGLQPGRDCAVAYLNWEPGLESLAGVDQHATLMGATAVDCLMGMLSRKELGLPETPQEIMIGCTWRDGPSAPPRQALSQTGGNSVRRRGRKVKS